MSLAIKLGLGLTGLAAIIVPGAWAIIQLEPRAITVNESKENNYSGKFGEDFKHHLVSTKNVDNAKWWDWSFQYRWQTDNVDIKDTEFSSLNNSDELKKKCEAAYSKETKNNIHKTSNDKYEKSIWRYCSLEGQKPVTVKDSNQKEDGSKDADSEKIGKKNSGDLISTLDTSNNKFWEIQEKAFFEEKGIGKKAKEDSSFKTLYSKTSKGTEDTLRNTWKLAFNKVENSSKHDKQHVLMFCSLLSK